MDNPMVLVIALPLAVALLNLVLPPVLRKLLIVAGLVAGFVLVKGFFDAHPPALLFLGCGPSGLALQGSALVGRGERAASTAKKPFIIVGGSDAFLILGLALAGMAPVWSPRGAPLPANRAAGG